jgi:hypothetical protein
LPIFGIIISFRDVFTLQYPISVCILALFGI